MRKVNLYLPRYAPGAGRPVFEDGDMFAVTVPLAGASQGLAKDAEATEYGIFGSDLRQVAGEVTGEVVRLLRAARQEMSRRELQDALGVKHEDHFREACLVPALQLRLIEMTIPGKPRSRLQKYRLTVRGRAVIERP